jgi:hypothetical protein
MSLVIIKVNRENKTHSIYADSICIGGSNHIYTNNCNKIVNVECNNYNILLGTTGDRSLAKYIRYNFQTHFRKLKYINFNEKNEIAEIALSDLFKDLIEEYLCKYEPSNPESICFNGCLSINGNIFDVVWYDKKLITVDWIDDYDYFAVGQENIAAMCMLDNGIEIPKIYETIKKFNCYVNDNVSKLENIKFGCA